jgi:hypothetical protein
MEESVKAAVRPSEASTSAPVKKGFGCAGDVSLRASVASRRRSPLGIGDAVHCWLGEWRAESATPERRGGGDNGGEEGSCAGEETVDVEKTDEGSSSTAMAGEKAAELIATAVAVRMVESVVGVTVVTDVVGVVVVELLEETDGALETLAVPPVAVERYVTLERLLIGTAVELELIAVPLLLTRVW